MQLTVQLIKDKVGIDNFFPGDVWMCNDPFLGGTHMPDVKLVKPFFYKGKLFAFLANTGHWQDIGGRSLGGFSPVNTEIYHDGIRIPGIKLYNQGQLNQDALDIILANIRNPKSEEGDLQAQLSALNAGEERLTTLIEDYGPDVIQECFKELLEHSEREMRSYISEMPDGSYSFSDYIDNDGIVDQPLKINLTVTVDGNTLLFDFAGTSPPGMGFTNLSRYATMSGVNLTLKHLYPEIPINGGCFRPVKFNIPDKTCLSAQPPTSVSGYLEAVCRVVDVVLGAMAKIVPDRTPAQDFGTNLVVGIGGLIPGTSTFFMVGWPGSGGYGGSKETDGMVHAPTPLGRAAFPRVETAEENAPILMNYLRIRDDSSGAGTHRGGCGSEFSVCLLKGMASGFVLGDRVDHVPQGVQGGLPAKATQVKILRHTGEKETLPLRSKGMLSLTEGDTIECSSPGGGGYGNPLGRDPEEVLTDVIRGYVSPETAMKIYGVSIAQCAEPEGLTSYTIDWEATRKLRGEKR
jgi:N-methylhydantoinase B